MSLHKLTAGDGYAYLTRQVAAGDVTELGKQSLAEYYSEKGERPGVWLGSGLAGDGANAAGVDGVNAGDVVSQEQMESLFGFGRHPNAEAIRVKYLDEAIAAGRFSDEDVPVINQESQDAGRLGVPFSVAETDPSDYLVRVTRAYNEYNAHPEQRLQYGATPEQRGEPIKDGKPALSDGPRPRHSPIPERVRSQIRTRIGVETFTETYGRAPLNGRELSGHISRVSRRGGTAVAGYDLTFSPVKSVSTLWALAPLEVAQRIEKAHDAAVREVISWAETNVIYTRRGRNGVQQRDTAGVLATAFTHRDTRAGDPDLHTHVAVANKVQDPVDGKWLSIDGRTLHKMTVTLSERYNTILERELRADLGLRFLPAPGSGRGNKRGVREIAGVDQDLMDAFSQRRQAITTKRAELVADFQTAHGRPPTVKEAGKLAQQANLATRDPKHEPRSLAQQRGTWRAVAHRVLGGPGGLDAMLNRVAANRFWSTKTLTDRQVADLAGQVIATLEESRAQFQPPHVAAEAARKVRGQDVAPDQVAATIDKVTAAALGLTVRIDRPDPVNEPAGMRRVDGVSVYEVAQTRLHTTTGILHAETAILDAAGRTDGRVVAPSAVTAALLDAAATGPALNPAQAQLVTEMATSGARVQLGLAPAGSGKTTAMAALAAAWTGDGGTVIGLAPSAVAAQQLQDCLGNGLSAHTIATLTFALNAGLPLPADLEKVDASTLVILDEAGMAGTKDLAATIAYVTGRGGSVRLIGDDQQLSAVAAGGVLADLAATHGAVTLSELHRFTHPDVGAAEGAATLALRAGHASEALGFYLDNDRVKVAGPDALPARVYTAWSADLAAGRSSLMLAYANDTVNQLNARARADRLAAADQGAPDGPAGPSVALASGLEASAGDTIVTRSNDRRLRITGTDFVKNGDRFTLTQVRSDGAVRARHHGTGHTITLPAAYVAASVDLGYATTFHGAQGQTVDTTHSLLTGVETRQLLYVGASRGRHTNTLYVPSGTDGDGHNRVYPEQVTPATAVEFLERLIARDDTQVSAHTQLRDQSDPARLLARAADRYRDALTHAAMAAVGPDRMARITAAVEATVPGVTDAGAWDTLAGHLAVLHLQGADPVAVLAEAAAGRELESARDVAAVLDWRLDTTGGHFATLGPTAWIPGVPAQLTAHRTFGAWLTARENQVDQFKANLIQATGTWTIEDAPGWARPLLGDPALLAQVAVWRAVEHVPDDEPATVGRPHPAVAARHWQKNLQALVTQAIGPATPVPAAVTDAIEAHAPRVASDPWWPVLADRLTHAVAAGHDVPALIADATTGDTARPLPDEHAAPALWSRLAPVLAPAAAAAGIGGSGAARLRPDWTGRLVSALPDGVGSHVLASPGWPTLVATVHTVAARTGMNPGAVATTAAGLLGAHTPTPGHHRPGQVPLDAVATVLAMRATDLTTPPQPDQENPPAPEDMDPGSDIRDFLTAWAAEDATANQTGRDTTTPTPPVTEPGPDDEQAPPDEEQAPPDPHDPAASDLAGPGTSPGRILHLNQAAAQFWAEAYPDSPAQAYLTDRLHTDPTTAGYTTGYAPPGWTTLTDHLRHQEHATDTELVDAGLARWTRRGSLIDTFRDRAVLGIHDTHGTLVGFVARDLTGTHPAKYLNTPGTAAFTKGAHLFGLHETRPTGQEPPRLALVEGPLDAIALTLAGSDLDHPIGGVASLTNRVTDTQADLLAAHATDQTIWQAPDTDPAGRAGMAHDHTALTSRGVTTRLLDLTNTETSATATAPGDGDPATRDRDGEPRVKDAAQAWHDTPDQLRTLLAAADQAPGTAQAVIGDRLTRIFSNRPDAEGRVQATRAAGDLIAALPPARWDETIEHAARVYPPVPWADTDDTTRALYAAVLRRALDWDPDTGTARVPPARAAEILHQATTGGAGPAAPDQAARRKAALARTMAILDEWDQRAAESPESPTDEERAARPSHNTARIQEALRKLHESDRANHRDHGYDDDNKPTIRRGPTQR